MENRARNTYFVIMCRLFSLLNAGAENYHSISPVYLFLVGGLLWMGIHYYRKMQKKRQQKQRILNEMLEVELENKKNELMKQTSTLTRKEMIINT